MRNSATHSGKDLAKEIALLKAQLDDLSDSVNGAGNSIVERGQEALEETLHSARELTGMDHVELLEDFGRVVERAVFQDVTFGTAKNAHRRGLLHARDFVPLFLEAIDLDTACVMRGRRMIRDRDVARAPPFRRGNHFRDRVTPVRVIRMAVHHSANIGALYEPHVAYRVPDVNAAIEGHEVLAEPFDVGDGFLTVAFVLVDGAVIEFMQYTNPDEEGWF